MFTIPDKVLAFWAARNAERRASGREPVMPMGAGDFRRIEAVWGLPLPEAYKRFLSAYGPVAFPDDFSAFDYIRNAPDGGRSILQGDIACMASVEVLE